MLFKDQGHNQFDSKFKESPWRSRTSGSLVCQSSAGWRWKLTLSSREKFQILKIAHYFSSAEIKLTSRKGLPTCKRVALTHREKYLKPFM